MSEMESGQRPLSELSPVAQRRNSPSWNQNKVTMSTSLTSINNTDTTYQSGLSDNSSPFDSSPMNASLSPRRFWQGRDTNSPLNLNSENRSPYDPDVSISSSKRSSIENLKKASRVKNSSMFAREHKQEYDPTQVQVLDRPLASGRPLSLQFQNFSNPAKNVDARRQLPSQAVQGKTGVVSPLRNPFGIDADNEQKGTSLTRHRPSPTKSSMSRGSKYGKAAFDPESEIWTDEEEGDHDETLSNSRSSHRHAKSVTFDAAPPQINEYEMTTPDPSSTASSSREGSYESDDFDEESFEEESTPDKDDSFDASLEDTEKTPVVLPDEWRFMSPANANDDLVQGEADPFSGDDYGSPDPDTKPTSSGELQDSRPRVESLDSNGEHRPLPPLPCSTSFTNSEHSSLTATMERASSAQRSLPSPLRPASYSKADISPSMSLEDRLQLMMIQDQPGSPDEESQRERKMRRAGVKERAFDHDAEDQGRADSPVSSQGDEDVSFDLGSSPPHISRESILRNLKGGSGDADDAEDSSQLDYSDYTAVLDPDVPIPSLEDDEVDEHASVKHEDTEHDIDMYSIPEYHSPHAEQNYNQPEQESNEAKEENGGYSHALENDDASRPHDSSENFTEEQSTPVPQKLSPKGRESANPDPNHPTHSEVTAHDNTFDLDQHSYVDQSSTIGKELDRAPALDMRSIRDSLQRPETPEQDENESYDVEEPKTPESVIRHPIDESPTPEEPEDIPDPLATVKAPGCGLKTRPSLTPADAEAMAATRRKVSGQAPPVPEVPSMDRKPSAGSFSSGKSSLNEIRPGAGIPSIPEKRQPSLVKLDVPVSGNDEGLSTNLDKEFDRLMEAQKVRVQCFISVNITFEMSREYL